MSFVDKAHDELKAAGIRVRVDDRFNLKPGNKFYEWERKGVPLRIECGPRDVEAGTVRHEDKIGNNAADALAVRWARVRPLPIGVAQRAEGRKELAN